MRAGRQFDREAFAKVQSSPTSTTPVATDNISALLDIIRPGIAAELVSNQNFPLRDKASTEQWIGNLSPNNTSSAKELYGLLPVAIKLDIDPISKMEILESLTPTVIRSTECLLQTPLNQETAKAISLGQALTRQLYEGYKLVIYQLGKAENLNHKKLIDALSKSILNACNVLAKMQLNSSSHYLQQPTFSGESSMPCTCWHILDVADLDITNPWGSTLRLAKSTSSCCCSTAPDPTTFPTTNCALSTVSWISGPHWQSCVGAAKGAFLPWIPPATAAQFMPMNLSREPAT